MDEEYENNLFLQCDKCRMMVHARCYGELEPVGGVLWLCNLCRPGAPEPAPPCCLCPVIGGAMKPTTDGRWAHLACAIWIPETCLSDVKRMEPIDGLSRINKVFPFSLFMFPHYYGLLPLFPFSLVFP
ncbi:histone-lysine N-methyltransferase TRX1-like [Prunus avium]|uniref:Histone-lysine N-methyltransferase TRX1-like n=1 Tax=Prunus avium TaxID=42229 RepID=A0A6P5RRM5_PRUAV|nr:histone-lysine N-methyltransferase TRX1-like [Prunus avium]